jgi:rhodanese-related sulfurtransferase
MIGPIAVAELGRLLDGGLKDPGQPEGKAHVFDLRAPDAFRAAHVPGADQVPPEQALRWIPQQAATQELVVLVDDEGAAHGVARHVAAELVHKWFRRVCYVDGGFAAWRAAGRPTEEGGAAGPTAASSDGTQPAFQESGAVPWKVVDPARAGRPI